MPDTAVVVVAVCGDGRAGFGAPSAAALGNDAKSAATAGQDHAGAFWDRQDQALRDKYRARRELAAITSLSRVKKCGRVSTNEGGEVLVAPHARTGGGTGHRRLRRPGDLRQRVGVPGVLGQDSARRSKDLEQLINWNARPGGQVALLTLTMRHHRGHSLPNFAER
ncbi:hypothetical protein [Pseudonocardia sp. Ae717_Ps2]|uniref:hypothetical protein n=1 Tax=Pseudonocardia sp. Ae717_Ps2 TaxID=1885573 RepID=UPI00094ADA50|nr:hypothetical protein [Pseudonocardia sp. Ae717_Ps2]